MSCPHHQQHSHGASAQHHDSANDLIKYPLRAVAWETTRKCILNCKHCRGGALNKEYCGELTTEEGKKLLKSIASCGRTVMIFTGGEPMSRPDIYELISYAKECGLIPVISPCGHLVTPETVKKLQDAGAMAMSISLDGADAKSHDDFRGEEGAFNTAVQAIKYAVAADFRTQINCTVSKLNVADLEKIHDLAVSLGAKAVDYFFLVPTGRGEQLKKLEISSAEYEDALNFIDNLRKRSPIDIRVTCAPHYARIQQQNNDEDEPITARGCLGGKGFAFISHTGIVQPCGFFNRVCGDLRAENYDFKKIYLESKIFNDLRDTASYKGSCGACKFVNSCGGCRARALEKYGDYMAAEPNCKYNAKKK
ncbi:radical SAM protein [Lentisphaerota bacterium WC36G]|nr:radical SAM protein [Lentisphaerae bacterium WC36]